MRKRSRGSCFKVSPDIKFERNLEKRSHTQKGLREWLKV
jgi:hypothetical protein